MVVAAGSWQPLAMKRKRDAALLTAIGRNIRTLRKRRGFSQEDLAGRANIQSATLSRVENGRVSPDVTTLHRIATGLSVNLAEVCDVDEGPTDSVPSRRDTDLLAALQDWTDAQRAALLVLVSLLGPDAGDSQE